MRLFVAVAISFVASPCLADPLLDPGHVLGNGSAAARTATDIPLIDIMNQSGSGLGTGVAGAGATAVNVPSGFALVNGAIVNGHCVQWTSSGLADGGPCGGGTLPSIASGLVAGNFSGSPALPVGVTPPVGYRNRLYNGDMSVWLQATSALSSSVGCTTSCNYAAEGWLLNSTGAAFTAARSASVTGFQYGLAITGAASNTAAYIAQRIEAANVYDLAGTTANLQVTGHCSGNQTVKWAVYYPTAADNYAAETQMATGTWSFLTSDALYGSNVSLTSNTVNGLEVRLYPQNGGAFTTGTCYFSGVQIEPGSFATMFERLPFSEQLRRSQRYFECSYDYGVVPGTASALAGADGMTTGTFSNSAAPFQGGKSIFKTMKRADPTITIFSPVTGASGYYRNVTTGVDQNLFTTTYAGGFSPGTSGFQWYIQGVGSYSVESSFQWCASARL